MLHVSLEIFVVKNIVVVDTNNENYNHEIKTHVHMSPWYGAFLREVFYENFQIYGTLCSTCKKGAVFVSSLKL